MAVQPLFGLGPLKLGRLTYLPRDRIRALLERDIDEYRNSSIKTFGLHISVSADESAGVIKYKGNQIIGSDKYSFTRWSGETVSFTVGLVDDKVKILIDKHWSPITEYLKHLEPDEDWGTLQGDSRSETMERRMCQQRSWWLANGKKFRLLDLPSELRVLIYGFALGARIEPYPTCKARGLGSSCRAIMAMQAPQPNSNILLTSKLVHREASEVLFKVTPFFVDRLGVLRKLLAVDEQYSRIRQLELSLSHVEYFKLFGFEGSDEVSFEPRHSTLQAMRSMRLDRLTLWFAPPCAKADQVWFDDACQQKVVDTILCSAWPFIRAHPVRVAGYIKDRSMRLFEVRQWKENEIKKGFEPWQRQREAAGLDEGDMVGFYENLDEEEGGVKLAEAEGEKEEQGSIDTGTVNETPVYKLPLTCHCKQRCGGQAWSPQ